MAITQQITCDVCGKTKGDVNHWWVGDFGGRAWGIASWSNDEASKPGRTHLCGQQCVTKAVSEWMQKATQ